MRLERTMQGSGMNWSGEKSENLTYANYPTGESRDRSGVSPLQVSHKQIVEGGKRSFSEHSHRGALLEEAVSSSMAERTVDAEEYACCSGSLLTLHPWLFRKDNIQVDMKWGSKLPIKYFQDMDDNANGMQSQVSPRNVGPDSRFGTRRKFTRSRHAGTFSKRPLDSYNCLIPRLYEDSEIEEFILNPLPSHSFPMRPFYISDGSQIISKMKMDLDVGLTNGSHSESDGGLVQFMTGFSPLPESIKPKRKTKKKPQRGLGTSISQQNEKVVSLPGSNDGLSIFIMGCTVGIVLTMMTKKQEVETLNAMLKQSENLVKDLEEELELKDSVTVKELVNESFGNQSCAQTCSDLQGPNNTIPIHSELHRTEQLYNKHSSGKAEEKSLPLSTIEAELEAELERLELNMNGSSHDESTFVLDDLDDEFISLVVKGELREDKIHGRDESQSDSCDISKQSSANHTPPANYSVSPKELCLRLYELNQRRLEERIKELEDALYHRQNYLHVEEVKRPICSSSSDISSAAHQDSPIVMEIAEASASQPLCINLSGDALDAYNEAYDEFMRITQTENNSTSTVNIGEQILGHEFSDSDGSLPWGIESGKLTEPPLEYKFCVTNDPCEVMANEEDNNPADSDDEEGRMLIQQIVERTKKGSPVVLDVQKLLLSMDK